MESIEPLDWRNHFGRQIVLLLGLIGIVGFGCATITTPAPKDERAVTQFLPGAEKGNSIAQYQLASSYRYGSSGLNKDRAKALQWMRLAAQAGNVDAQFALGDMLLNPGEGQTPQLDEAVQWFGKSAEKNLGNRLWLAGLLETGRPGLIQADVQAARVLYLKSVGESRLARQRLGIMAERGLGGDTNLTEALKWYLLAESSADIERLKKHMSRTDAERAKSDAARWKP